jgi:hypothetical protein
MPTSNSMKNLRLGFDFVDGTKIWIIFDLFRLDIFRLTRHNAQYALAWNIDRPVYF